MFNDETEVEVVEEVEETEAEPETEVEEVEEDQTDWKAEALKYKAILDRNKDKKPATNQKSNDFGYDLKAYLKASGIQASEFDFVKAKIKETGIKDIDTLLESKYFTTELENHRAVTKTAQAIPRGSRSGGVATDSVEYWLSKPFEEVPADKRRDVVNARIAKERNQGKFYNS